LLSDIAILESSDDYLMGCCSEAHLALMLES